MELPGEDRGGDPSPDREWERERALEEAVKESLEGQTEDFYFSGINSLSEKCRKCIELSKDYIEK